MNLKEIKCPNCKRKIKITNNNNKGICKYCQNEIFINNEKIEIKHHDITESTDNTLLKDAENALNKLKDYEKSTILYRQLLTKYVHKREIYIGLIRSITKDFTINTINYYQLEEINKLFKKYKILATDDEIMQYENKMRNLNKNYWYNVIITKTNNFNSKTVKDDPLKIEKFYQKYESYCTKKENIIKKQYEIFMKDYLNILEKKKKKKKKIITITIIITIIIILLSFLLLYLNK